MDDLARGTRPGSAFDSGRDPSAVQAAMYDNHLLSSLSPEALADLEPDLREAPLGVGDILIEEGRRPDLTWFPASAGLAVLKSLEDGRVVQLASLGRFECAEPLSCLSDAPSRLKVVVQVAGSGLGIDNGALRRVAARHPEVLALLVKGAGLVARQVEQNLACTAYHDATRRLARWLLMLADRSARDEVRLTQEELAIMTGVQRTTVNASAMALRSAGLIRYSRSRIGIADRGGLERAACGCYRETSPARPETGPV
jgi:CRP-like cAMP-binding protein